MRQYKFIDVGNTIINVDSIIRIEPYKNGDHTIFFFRDRSSVTSSLSYKDVLKLLEGEIVYFPIEEKSSYLKGK